ncbi:hypothetical protein K466DRAFT_606237 [Polyporus arcularius HHB13444]|uniref:Uncharacterized protein n=1 Tax=Polyporus arcularius HHB13444 TaxID=1314778 RepID=A0A5C3NRW4_9APHY|nr:hypothetical protein K466DRAFT_606237 [Polyporus arcularius HHB13444]
MPSSSNIEKLLKKIAKPSRKVGVKRTLYPWTTRRRRQHQKLSKQERKDLQARRDGNRAALKAALHAARSEIYERATEMAAQFGHKHTPGYYYRLIMQQSKLKEEPRKISLWNAFVSKEVERHNAEVASGDRDNVSKGVIKEIARKWKSLSPEEREAEVGDRLEELQGRQSERKLVVHNEALAAFNDTRATLALIQRELEYLKGRTDTVMSSELA